MIDAFSTLHRFSPAVPCTESSALLFFKDAWRPSAGSGVVVGLLDTSFDTEMADLEGADIYTRDFTGSSRIGAPIEHGSVEHGSHSVMLLVGQGRRQIRGIVPNARLCVATVVAEDGLARAGAVADAIDWLSCSGVQVVIVPLGDDADDEAIVQPMTAAAAKKTVFFAAAGNTHPGPILFPARHPLAIAVGAADSHANLLPDCCRQPRLDLIAPGWKIAAPVRHGIVRQRSGSSVACVVAGAIAALALSAGAFFADSFSRTSVLNAVTKRLPSESTGSVPDVQLPRHEGSTVHLTIER